jgi:hypothetical protein
VLGRAARLLIHKEPIGKAVELLCTLIRADTTPVQLVTLLHYVFLIIWQRLDHQTGGEPIFLGMSLDQNRPRFLSPRSEVINQSWHLWQQKITSTGTCISIKNGKKISNARSQQGLPKFMSYIVMPFA